MSRYDEDKPSDDLAFNVQNIPERARHIYIPDEGMMFVEVDASKIDWIFMMLDARCVRAERAYREGVDVHTMNAKAISRALHLEWEKLRGEERVNLRRGAKRYTHGWDFGMTAHTTGRLYRLTLSVAKALRDGYFAEWPEVLEWQKSVEEDALRDLSLRNCFGRQRRFLDVTTRKIGGKLKFVLGELNEALAFRPASMTADLWKISLRDLFDEEFREVAGLHDSHLLQVPEDEVEEKASRAIEICERPIPELAGYVGAEAWTPIWEAKVGRNWGPWSESNPNGLSKLEVRR
jgi:DNA polymerase I-like protein with 3'-5' exonuclease and polymerase domains